MNPVYDDYTGEYYDKGKESARRMGMEHMAAIVRKHLDKHEDCKGEVTADGVRGVLRELMPWIKEVKK